jgi:hypothetical protein
MTPLWLLLLRTYTSAVSVSYVPDTGTTPPHRELPGLIYDSATNKAYVFGGRLEMTRSDMW